MERGRSRRDSRRRDSRSRTRRSTPRRRKDTNTTRGSSVPNDHPKSQVPVDQTSSWTSTETEWDSKKIYTLEIPRCIPDTEWARKRRIANRDPLSLKAYEILWEGTNGYPFRKLANGKYMVFQGCRSAAEWAIVNSISKKLGQLTQQHRCSVDDILQRYAKMEGLPHPGKERAQDVANHLLKPLFKDLDRAANPEYHAQDDVGSQPSQRSLAEHTPRSHRAPTIPIRSRSPRRSRSISRNRRGSKRSRSAQRRPRSSPRSSQRESKQSRSRKRSRSRSPDKRDDADEPKWSQAIQKLSESIKSLGEDLHSRMDQLHEKSEGDPNKVLKKFERGSRKPYFKSTAAFNMQALKDIKKKMSNATYDKVRLFEQQINDIIKEADKHDPPFSTELKEKVEKMVVEWGVPADKIKKVTQPGTMVHALAIANVMATS